MVQASEKIGAHSIEALIVRGARCPVKPGVVRNVSTGSKTVFNLNCVTPVKDTIHTIVKYVIDKIGVIVNTPASSQPNLQRSCQARIVTGRLPVKAAAICYKPAPKGA